MAIRALIALIDTARSASGTGIAEFYLVAHGGQVPEVRDVRPVVVQECAWEVRALAVVVLRVELREPHRREADGFPCDTCRLDA